MDRDSWAQVKRIVLAASEREESGRASFLDEACGDDTALRDEVESLLSYDTTAKRTIEAPVLGMASELLIQLSATSPPDKGPSPEEMVGKSFAHYRVLEKIGAGGMGVVYKAEDTRLGRFVALKFLSPLRPGDVVSSLEHSRYRSDAVERFRREARASSALDHPNICTVYDVGEYDGSPFIAMQFLAGQSLRAEVNGKPLPMDRVLEVGVQIADALNAAHSAGIVHRDIKPGNIFVTQRGEAKILDFGLAKLAQNPDERPLLSLPATLSLPGEHTVTNAGTALGTVAYMSPEQVRGEQADGRSDLFSFGVVLYEMATGVQPFKGETTEALFDKILHQTPTSVSTLNPNISKNLESAIHKALEKEPSARYHSASDLRDDLKRLKLASDSSLLAVREAKPSHKRAWSLAAILFVLIGIAGVFLYRHRQPLITDQETIVLGDFTNDTGDAIFEHTLKQALRVRLEQSPYLTILSDNKVGQQLRFMGRSPTAQMTKDMAREVCLRAGSKALLQGSVAPLGSHYVIGLEAVNCQTGDDLDTEQVEAASREAVLPALDKAALKIRRKLGESLASIQQYGSPFTDATTPSLEAFQAYSLGTRTRLASGDAASIPFFKQATQMDPNFAMAYAQLGTAYLDLSQLAGAVEAFKKAHDLRDRTVSEREKLFIDCRYYLAVTGELEKAVQILLQWERTYPHDIAPHLDLGNIYAVMGWHQKQLEEQQAALRLDHDHSFVYHNLAIAYLNLNQFDKAQQLLEQAENHKVPRWASVDLLYELAFLRGDEKEMRQQLASATKQPEFKGIILSSQADTEAYHGRLAKARDLSNQASASARSTADLELASGYQITEALTEAEFGYPAIAQQQVRTALKNHPSQMVQTLAALAFGLSGDTRHATKIAGELGRQFPLDTMLNNYWLPTIRAAVELDRRNPTQAIAFLQATTPYELGTPATPTEALPYPIYLRALALLERGEGKEAAAEFQKILDNPGITLNFPLGSLARLGLARSMALEAGIPLRFTTSAQERSVNKEEVDPVILRKARAAYESFFAIWKDADRDLPILRQANKEYESLCRNTSHHVPHSAVVSWRRPRHALAT